MIELINAHIYPSTFRNDSRILKETESLIKLGLVQKILMIGIWEEGLPRFEKIDENRSIIRIQQKFKKRRGFVFFTLKYLYYQFQVIGALRRLNVNIVNCHSLAVLGIGVYFKIFKNLFLIYDTHELSTEVAGSRGLKKIGGRIFERSCIYFVDEVIVVNDSIGNWYKKKYNIKNLGVLRNVPHYFELNLKPDLFREKFNIPKDQLIFIYQGLLSKGRGVNIIIDAFLESEQNHHIVFMGMGELADEIKTLSHKKSNIHFVPAVPPSEVRNYTASADIGIHLIQNTCLNHYYCSPNKVFEYLMYGIPQIVSDFPEIRNIIYQGECGWLVNPEKKNLLLLLENITRAEVMEKTKAVLERRNELGWEKEEASLVEVYGRLNYKMK
jgi:glycosyltransferase involved in cell wall biosynthesis